MSPQERARKILLQADIAINGPNPWDIQVRNNDLFDRVFADGTLALGESYMDEWWSVTDLPAFTYRLLRQDSSLRFFSLGVLVQIIKSKFFNLQNRRRAFHVGQKHYDIGNPLYKAMLGKEMLYSCGYWKTARSLDEAQEHKMDLICKKIGLKAGQRILDVGSGWGGFAKFAAEKYGVMVVGVTVSKEQAEYSRNVVAGLPVEIRLQDWRELSGEKFDHIISIGMFEHVGPHNYRAFMQKMSELLQDDGLFLLHTIGHSKTVRSVERWFHKYIFPNGHLPSVAQIGVSIDRQWFEMPLFIVEDWHNFGIDYDKTLTQWFKNFDAAWPELKKDYDDRFYLMWKYYLQVSAGMFRARYLQVWQIVLSKKGVEGGYVSIR